MVFAVATARGLFRKGDPMEFYVLTTGELFCVRTSGDKVSAIQLMEWSDNKHLRGVDICKDHPMLFIGAVVASYTPQENNRMPSKDSAWGPMSNAFVALFASHEKAQEAFDTRIGMSKLPEEWAQSTREVILSLGRDCDGIWIALDPVTGVFKTPFAA